MPRPLRLLLPTMLVLAAVLPAAAQATSPPVGQVDTAELGAVKASFSYRDASDGRWEDLRLAVWREGRLVHDAPPDVEGCAQPYCAPGAMGDAPSIQVADLEGDGEPEVVVDLYSGGAHCCVIALVLRWNGSGYAGTSRSFGDPGYALEPAAQPGEPMTFVTGDHRFAYAFAPFGFTRFPVRLLTFVNGRWRDVTNAHPETLRAQSADLLAEYRKHRKGREGLGILAAWVADQWRLGRRVQAYRLLTRELHAGRLRGDRPWPRRLGYIASLTRHLTIWGYDPRPRD